MKSEKITPHPSAGGGEPKRSRLGEILVANGAITPEQLDHALAQQVSLKLPIGQVLLKLDYVTDETMRQALGQQLNVPYLDLENVMMDRNLARVINATFARRHALLPVATVGRTLTVAMDDPTALAIVQDLARLTGFNVTVVTSSSRAIQRAFRRLYDDGPDGRDGARPGDAVPAHTQMIGAETPEGLANGTPADGVLGDLLARAVADRSSDLHLDVTPAGIAVGFRVDGVLRRPDLGTLQERLNRERRELAVRLRRLAQMDLMDHQRPQEGRVQIEVPHAGRPVTIDLRVSVVPALGGDSIAIRLIERAVAPRALEQLGLAPAVLAKLKALLTRPSGVLLVTGAARTGAAETLHACLLTRDPSDTRVVTVEQPIEFVNDAVVQTEPAGEGGAPRAAYLRALLRHDPDVIMITDVSDRETAALAFRAAQDGRLVLASVPGGGAVDAVPALADLGVAASAIGQGLIGVLSQRLVRRVCETCRRAQAACSVCGSTGFLGHLILADLWVPDEQDALLITQQAPFADLRRSARRTTLAIARDAHDRLTAGQTTLDELRRVLPPSVLADLA